MKPRGLRDLEPRGNRYRHPLLASLVANAENDLLELAIV